MENKKNWNQEKGLILTIVILGIAVIALFIYVYMPKSTGIRQYPIDIIEITGNCKDCFDTGALADALVNENNTNLKSRKTLDYNSQEAKKIIDEYSIKTIPALIILSKDIEKIGIDEKIFSVNKNYALFDKSVPYIDLNTNEAKGFVQLKEIRSENCAECASLSQLGTELERLGVKVKDYEIINLSSDRGKNIAEQNELNFTSALLISKNIKEYWWIFNQIGGSLIEKKEDYLFKTPIPPYLDLKDRKIKGKVGIIYIENKSCEDCFNVSSLKESFQSLGVYIYNEEHVDVSSVGGKTLLNEYNITAIPTVILSKDIKDYPSIKKTLEEVGTFENDGRFVFRKLDLLNVKYQGINERR